tara:strand:+ start:237 stop:824 length:588 start_codon:yes stop_codon:yes gene_type:complete
MRSSEINRKTSETEVVIKVNLDGSGVSSFSTGLPFLEHMLDQIARHGIIDLDINAEGDLHIDNHHTIEDIGITFGQAIEKALGDKSGIRRYGFAYIPLDEALSRVVLDFSGRPGLFMNVNYARETVGDIEVGLFEHFFQSFCNHAHVTMHIDNLSGDNTHHQIETIFKAFGKALRMAVEVDVRLKGEVPSTKGSL